MGTGVGVATGGRPGVLTAAAGFVLPGALPRTRESAAFAPRARGAGFAVLGDGEDGCSVIASGEEAAGASGWPRLSVGTAGTAATGGAGLLLSVSLSITSGATTPTRAAGAPLSTRTCTTWVRSPKAVMAKPAAHTNRKAANGRRCSAANMIPP